MENLSNSSSASTVIRFSLQIEIAKFKISISHPSQKEFAIMLKIIDKLLIKIGLTRTNSPNLNAKMKEDGTINQRSVQMEGQNCYFEGNISFGKSPSWSEKKIAAENLINAMQSFFFSALGRNGRGGYLDSRNLDDNGSIKKSCLLSATREFANAKEKLKNAINANAVILEETDQIQLHELHDTLLRTAIDKVTEKLKEESSSTINSILEKYLKKKS